MAAPNPNTATTKAERITAYKAILAQLYQAYDDKLGRGALNMGEINIAWTTYAALLKQIHYWERKVKLAENPALAVGRSS